MAEQLVDDLRGYHRRYPSSKNKRLRPRSMHSLKIESMNEQVGGYISFVCLSLTNSTDQNRPRPLINDKKQDQ
jgi:hypothetical protein